ncbi:hypothetical protein [Aliifodinibius sp. S!AR15-10]|uniref:hypothetical protein n=1 Tax=Aliifodinibius sp. S!AR15-10 TaxID=2950437 RepID=UPI00287044CC|nr:hypothetical protein [Aliifodinibius sp. S!AR15-10]
MFLVRESALAAEILANFGTVGPAFDAVLDVQPVISHIAIPAIVINTKGRIDIRTLVL